MKMYIIILFLIFTASAYGQRVIADENRTITIENTIEIGIFQQADCPQCYYYLPTNLSIAMDNDRPEISLIKWDKEGDTDGGAILHFLVSWQLSSIQQLQLEKKIVSSTKDKAVIMGPLNIEAMSAKEFFYGEHDLVDVLNRTLQSIPSISTTPGSKMAFSFRLTGEEITVLEDYLNDIDVYKASLKLFYTYKAGFQQEQLELILPLKNILIYLK